MKPLTVTILGLLACGGATSVATLAPTPDETPAPPAAEPIAETAPAPPAEGTQLAAGRLGSVLAGLAAGSWEVAEGEAEGPDVATDHVLTRTTDEGTYPLHVVAWESFRAVPADADLARAAVARAGEGSVLFASEDGLGVAAQLRALDERVFGAGPEDWLYSRGALFIAQVSVAVQDATFVNVTLACDDSPACRSEDREGLMREFAASLRRGPALRRDARWEIRVPRGSGSDTRIAITLPDGLVGLPPRPGYLGARIARAIDTATGREAMSVQVGIRNNDRTLRFEPGSEVVPDPIPTSTRFGCAPFRCSTVLSRDDTQRAQLAAAFAAAEVEEVAARETSIPLAAGRLTVILDAPSLSTTDSDYEGVETSVRYQDKLIRLRVRDTLRPAPEALTLGFFAQMELIAPDQSNVAEIESGHSSLSITRIVPVTPYQEGADVIGALLLVSEQAGTGLIVELLCHHADVDCAASAPERIAELALLLQPGNPVATTPTLNIALAGRRMQIDLPEGYVTREWYGEHHGGWGVRAHNTRGPVAVLEFENSGSSQGASIENTGRRTGRRTSLRLGDDRFVMRERRRSYDDTRVWGADLGCDGMACVVLIQTSDLAERDRLLAALAAARVTRIQTTPCTRAVVEDEDDDTLNLREHPTTHSPVIRALDNGTEVTIDRTRGPWSRLAAPNAGWVWSASIHPTCDD